MWNNVFACNCECARGCDVTTCAAGNKRIGSQSERCKTDRPITDPVKNKRFKFFGYQLILDKSISANTQYLIVMLISPIFYIHFTS